MGSRLSQPRGAWRRAEHRRVEVRGTTQDVVRQHNMATLLGHIHRRGSTSRAELTRILGLNRSTIAALVDDLATRGLVVERITRERGTPGRPSHLVAIRTDTIAALAVVLGVDAVTVAVVAPGGHVLERTEIGLDRERIGLWSGSSARSAASSRRWRPVSLPDFGWPAWASPCRVWSSAEDGVVHFAPNLGWREVPFGARMATRLRSQVGLSIPVLCRNDASLGAVAEHIRGIGSSVANLVYIHAEVGVGGGIIGMESCSTGRLATPVRLATSGSIPMGHPAGAGLAAAGRPRPARTHW